MMEQTEVEQEPTTAVEPQALQGPAPEVSDGVLQGAVSEEKKSLTKADQAYINGLMKLLHSKDTAPAIDEMLQSGPPEKTIPAIILQVSDQLDSAIGKKPELGTSLMGGVYLANDLIEIGNAGGFFQLDAEKSIGPILKSAMQQYIERGLKDGSIDPVELQTMTEPLLNEQQKAAGMKSAGQHGLPGQANESVAMSSYGSKMQRKGMMQAGGGR